jgi:hypothetical protein
MWKKSSRKIDSFSVCFLLQYIFFKIWNSSNQALYCGDIDVLTRVQPNIAKQIYNIVYFSYYFFSYLNIYDYFFCYFYQFKHISLKASENGKQLTSDRGATVTAAVYQYEYMVSCDIPASRKRRSTDKSVEGYDLSLSYDGTNYGDSVSFIIYDEDCFTCNGTTVTCVRLVSCVLI